VSQENANSLQTSKHPLQTSNNAKPFQEQFKTELPTLPKSNQKQIPQKRNLPGPLGTFHLYGEAALQDELHCTRHSNIKPYLKYRKSQHNPFYVSSWLSMLHWENLPPYDNTSELLQYTTTFIKHSTAIKIPKFVGLIVQLEPVDDRALVVLIDPYGEIQGTISKGALAEHYDKLKIGCVLILHNVSAISAHLIISNKNITNIFPNSCPFPENPVDPHFSAMDAYEPIEYDLPAQPEPNYNPPYEIHTDTTTETSNTKSTSIFTDLLISLQSPSKSSSKSLLTTSTSTSTTVPPTSPSTSTSTTLATSTSPRNLYSWKRKRAPSQ